MRSEEKYNHQENTTSESKTSEYLLYGALGIAGLSVLDFFPDGKWDLFDLLEEDIQEHDQDNIQHGYLDYDQMREEYGERFHQEGDNWIVLSENVQVLEANEEGQLEYGGKEIIVE